MNLTETQRGWLYVGAALIGVAAVVFGVARWEDVQTVITGLVLVLTGGLATKNTLLKNHRVVDDPEDRDRGYTVGFLLALVCVIVVVVVLLLLLLDVINIKG